MSLPLLISFNTICPWNLLTKEIIADSSMDLRACAGRYRTHRRRHWRARRSAEAVEPGQDGNRRRRNDVTSQQPLREVELAQLGSGYRVRRRDTGK